MREEKKQALRETLYTVALGLFREKGYDAVSIADITAAAGVAKGTFFNHFPSKAHLLAQWYARIMHVPALETGADIAAALEIVLIDHLREVEADIDLISAKIAHEADSAVLAQTERDYDARLAVLLAGILDRDPAVTICPAQVSPIALAEAVVTYITGIGREWRQKRDRTSLVELGRARLDTLLVMLRGNRFDS